MTRLKRTMAQGLLIGALMLCTGALAGPAAAQPDPPPDSHPAPAPDGAAPRPQFEPLVFEGRLDNDHRRQRYAIDLPANGALLLDVTTGEGLNLYHGVRVLDADGDAVLFRQHHGSDTQREYEVTHLRAGRYHLELVKDSRRFYEGDYRVRAGFRPVSVPADPAPNDAPDQAVPLEPGTLVTGHLGFRGQGREADREDWYVLDLPRDGTLVLHVTTSGDAAERDPIRPADGNLNLHGGVFVLAGDGETRLYGTRHSHGREQEHVIEDLAAGRYFIRLVKDGRDFYWGSYTLHARSAGMPAPSLPDPWPWLESGADRTADRATDRSTDAPAPGSGWARYVNARFGTAVDYPADLFEALPPPANDDGRAFEARDGSARFRVFAGHNVFDQTLFELMIEASQSDAMGRIARADMLDDRALIEGERDGRVRLHVILDQQEAGIVHQLMIDHDKAAADQLAPIAARMAESLTVEAPLDIGTAPAAEPDAVELVFWQSIADSQDPADFRAYLDRWPHGEFAVLARNRLRQLAEAEAVTPPDVPPSPPQAALPPPPPPNPQAYTTPRPGSSERAAIMDAARIPVSQALGQDVVFVVSTLRMSGGWAYLDAVPQQPDGRALDWSRTPYADAWQADMMSDLVMVLLVDDGSGWRAIEHVIGPTDVHWLIWVDELGLPEALFFGG